MTSTITALYDTYSAASAAVRGLEAAGVPHSDISIVANNSENWHKGDASNASTTLAKAPALERRSAESAAC